MIQTQAHITADFSNQDEEGRVFARKARASRELTAGEHVLVTDDEGHACQANVAAVDDELVYLALDWDTWIAVEVVTDRSSAVGMSVMEPSFVSNGAAPDVHSESAPALIG